LPEVIARLLARVGALVLCEGGRREGLHAGVVVEADQPRNTRIVPALPTEQAPSLPAP
jgi:hypothetical protein